MNSCWQSFVKYFVVIFNLFFALAGLVLIGLGTYLQVKAKQYLDFLNSTYTNTPIVLIIIGVAIFIVAFLACCGACTEKSWMVYTYSGILLAILLTQFGAGIAAFVLNGDLSHTIESNMVDGMKNYGTDEHGGVTDTWDFVQQELKCCGVETYTDWGKVQGGPQGVPDSCCKHKTENCGNMDMETGFNISTIYTDGCLVVVEEKFVSNIGLVAAAVVGLALVEVLGIIMSCYLGSKIKRAEQYERFY